VFKSSSSSITNLFFEYSYALTISSFFTSRSQTGQIFWYLIGVSHSLCNCLSATSLFSVAACILTGILTSPKLMVPFHIVCIQMSPCIVCLGFLFHWQRIVKQFFNISL